MLKEVRLRYFVLCCFCWLVIAMPLAGQVENKTNDSLPDYFDENFIRFDNYIYNESIHSVQIYKSDDVLSLPVIGLNSSDKLLLSFDDLANESKDYYYRIIHCTSDWEDSRLSYYDYIDGFEENQISDFRFSFNTFRNYCHYDLLLPNKDVQFKVSGNYLIKVYGPGSEDLPVFTHRFMLFEPLVYIDAIAKRSTILDEMNSHQEIDFSIKSQITINDPYRELKVVLMQNGRRDNCIDKLQPKFIRNNELLYDLESENSFAGGNEFRFFNCKDVEFKSQGIDIIRYEKPWFYFDLEKDQRRRFKVYFFGEDINGKYKIDMADAYETEIEADYVYVKFSLAYDAPVVNGDIYVFGALTAWGFNKNNKMKYNFDDKCYELTMLLKQGYYNYCYAFLKDGQQAANTGYIEGNHYETENDYQIFVYLKENSSRYEKLIGFSSVNSLRKL
ncbi:MAG: DUF5103 domain-containing protein [Bacteroidota bacterium]|nr:DUF5103 domain-containing protein [Bacteroidota bacterium]